ncbi:hypothetical protein Baya_10057 [Bagarius yarrelli]|uniref:Uncharacterized protein n=1 Tax=Bagarius yarrelli TaxID=175774 RepID=A0A556UEQ7_BAGYA|nr:hypothetical protein Baya_10057 [Bagarius yarrelli]
MVKKKTGDLMCQSREQREDGEQHDVRVMNTEESESIKPQRRDLELLPANQMNGNSKCNISMLCVKNLHFHIHNKPTKK